MEPTHHLARPLVVAGHEQANGASLSGLPVGAQGLHQRRLNQPLHIDARRIVGAQFRALVRGQGLFQQGAEDGRLDRGPVALGGGYQSLQFILGDRQGGDMAEQAAVEPTQGLADGRAVPALVHAPEEVARAQMKLVGVAAIAFQKAPEALVLDQAHAVSEHGEDALHDEQSRLIGSRRLGDRVRASIRADGDASADRTHQPGQAGGDVGRDLGHAGGRVQAQRIGPDTP
ncbi:hypothetical protein D3C80_1331730 [compost metagenome]